MRLVGSFKGRGDLGEQTVVLALMFFIFFRPTWVVILCVKGLAEPSLFAF